MNELVNGLLQQGMLFSAVIICLVVLAASLHEIETTLTSGNTKNKRAKRKHITVIIEARTASTTEVVKTIDSLKANRYRWYDIVVIAARGTTLPNVRIYQPAPTTKKVKILKYAYSRSRKGEYVVYLNGGGEVLSTLLQDLNRTFHFSKKTNTVALQSNLPASSLEHYHHIIATTFLHLVQGAFALFGVVPRSLAANYAVRSYASKRRHAVIMQNAFTKNAHSYTKFGWFVSMAYLLAVVVVVASYLFWQATAQLVALTLFMAVVSIIFGILQQNRARRMLLLFSPSAIFALFAAILIGIAQQVSPITPATRKEK